MEERDPAILLPFKHIQPNFRDSEAATGLRHSMKRPTTGLSVRWRKVTIASGLSSIGS